ncbi:Phosphatidylinositol (PI) 3-kinase [Haplosporangium bisporale]|nr:Phosphatidylinositol (PI) 3-kinase [Haplosporangium bisporale]
MNVVRDVSGEKFKNYKDYSFCLTGMLDLNLKTRSSGNQSDLMWMRNQYLTPPSAEGNQPLTVLLKTSYKPMSSKFAWNEWITLPIKYRDLPLNAQLCFTIWEAASPRKVEAIGGSTLKLFGLFNIILTGPQKLHMWPDCEADGSEFTKTPSDTGVKDEMDRFEKKHAAQSDKMLLNIDLPRFDFPVIFDEHEYQMKQHPLFNNFATPTNTAPPSTQASNAPSSIFMVQDHEIARENPVEAKHRRLVRSHRNSPLDRELKPNPKIRDELNALTKFLKSVVWSDPAEAKQAVDLLPAWVDIDVDDALELLGSGFENREVRSYAVGQLRSANDDDLLLFLLQLVQGLKFEHIDNSSVESNLAEFLIERSVKNPVLGNYFYWYLMIEYEDPAVGRMYGKVSYQYMSAMSPTGGLRRQNLHRQAKLIETLANLSKSVKQMRESRPKRIEKLQEYISDPKNELMSFEPLALPLDPRIEVNGIIPRDDLRQDQLVIQLITLMDDLLRKENLDLKLMPYKVLATGVDHGMVQFVPAQSLANVLSENGGSLQMFWRTYHLGDHSVDTFGVRPDVMDAYVKSCAGYCVIMYLLGVGDRHLDNLLLSPNGNIFHVDFGFILGRDPKPFPAPMKITKEMVEAMGGFNSVHYQSFKSYCFTAYNILRKSANLILNLFGLMTYANIPDIKMEPDKAVWKVEERFQLDLTDDEAIKFFQNLINESLSAVIPQIAETIHTWTQAFRK